MSDTKEKKQRTPKQPDSIFRAALSLPLKQKVDLRNQLSDSIEKEVEFFAKQFEDAKQFANGNK